MAPSLLEPQEKTLLQSIGGLNYTNPFTPERLNLEKTILGKSWRPYSRVWNMHSKTASFQENVRRIFEASKEWSEILRGRLEKNHFRMTEAERDIYEPVVLYYLFEKYRNEMIARMQANPAETFYPEYEPFRKDYRYYMEYPGRDLPGVYTAEKTFAMYFQIHRAFYYIFDFIVGSSYDAGDLRASIWQSIFTCDIYRYHRVLFNRMNSISTLITGESGTGKELVARAIAYSQYIPFSEKTMRFEYAYSDCFAPVQLSAMPKTMLESELFGHRKGAYTGALTDRKGYLEACLPSGSVFLDEIGEVDPETQVKLLRVLQNRTFQRLGENSEIRFRGKIISATNRDLSKACGDGDFRNDLYYRLCADTIRTVPLRKLIRGESEELEHFVNILAGRILGKEETARFTPFAQEWIQTNLGPDYPWPGNVRELEQCVRNLIIRGQYIPAGQQKRAGRGDPLEEALSSVDLTADEVMFRYLSVLYRRAGTFAKTAELAGLDRRTVKKILSRPG